MVKHVMAASVLALCVGTAAAIAQVPSQPPGTYAWHGELVSLDEAGRTLTAKVHVLEEAARQVASFDAGDRVVLVWSGFDRYAGSVRRVVRADMAQKVEEMLTLPVELVSRDVQNNFTTVRFRVPEVPAAVKALKPGEWVTVTSRQRPGGEDQAVVSLRPYANPAPLDVAS